MALPQCGFERFIGAFARKLLFVLIYTSFLYTFFVLALITTIVILANITHVASEDITNICHASFIQQATQQQCTDLLEVTTGVLWAVPSIILAFDLCKSCFPLLCSPPQTSGTH